MCFDDKYVQRKDISIFMVIANYSYYFFTSYFRFWFMFIGIITSLNIFYWAISILLTCFHTLYIKHLLSKVIYLYHILREILNSWVDFCKTIPRDKKNLLVELFTHRGLCSDEVLLLHLLNEQRIQRNFSLILSFIFI